MNTESGTALLVLHSTSLEGGDIYVLLRPLPCVRVSVLYRLDCKLYAIHYILYIIRFTLCTIHFPLFSTFHVQILTCTTSPSVMSLCHQTVKNPVRGDCRYGTLIKCTQIGHLRFRQEGTAEKLGCSDSK